MRTAIITMVHNEAVFLPLWIRHYNKFIDVQLIVIDNGSTDGSTDNIPDNVEKITFPHKEKIRDTLRITSISDLQNSLINYYNCVIYTDVDEFLVVDPELETDLISIIKDHQSQVISPIGLNLIQKLDREVEIDFDKSILNQRKHVIFTSAYSKPIITREKTRWMPGFHGCSQWPRVCPSIFLFHLRLVDLEFSLRRTEQRLERTPEGVIWDVWGRTRDQMVSYFNKYSAMQIVDVAENFKFDDLIAKAMDNVAFSPDKTLKRLGHVESPSMHIVPEKFVESISGIG